MGEAKLPDFIFTRDKAAEKDSFMFVGTLVTNTPRGRNRTMKLFAT
jgi:hypothetical protein